MGGCLSTHEPAREDGGTHLPKYEWVGELGSGRKGEIKLMRNRRTQDLVAVKYIARQVQYHVSLAVNSAAATTLNSVGLCVHSTKAANHTGWCGSERKHRKRASQSSQAVAPKHHQVSLHVFPSPLGNIPCKMQAGLSMPDRSAQPGTSM